MKAKVLVYSGRDQVLPQEYQEHAVWTPENGHYLFNSWICSKTDFDGEVQVIKGIEHIFDPFEIAQILPDLLNGPFIITTSSIQVIAGSPEVIRMSGTGEIIYKTNRFYGQPAEVISKDLMGYSLVPSEIQELLKQCYEGINEKNSGKTKEGIDKLEALNPDLTELVTIGLHYNRLLNTISRID